VAAMPGRQPETQLIILQSRCAEGTLLGSINLYFSLLLAESRAWEIQFGKADELKFVIDGVI
jgi:hypothetical protein